MLDCDRGSPNAKRLWEWHLWMISCGLVGSIAVGMGWDSQLSLSPLGTKFDKDLTSSTTEGPNLNTSSFISYVRTESILCLCVEF